MNRQDMRNRCEALYPIARAALDKLRGPALLKVDAEQLPELVLRLALETIPPDELAGEGFGEALFEIRGELALLRDAAASETFTEQLTPQAQGGICVILNRAVERLDLLSEWMSMCNDKVNELALPDLPRRVSRKATAE